jgi:hypothetical protein
VLFDAVVEHGLEGIVAKRRDGIYRSGQRGWVKTKNPNYWRRESEIVLMQRRQQGAGANSPQFVRMANRMANLRPVRIQLTRALRTGRSAYITTLNGVPIAFTEKGWLTQEQVDAKLAPQRGNP